MATPITTFQVESPDNAVLRRGIDASSDGDDTLFISATIHRSDKYYVNLWIFKNCIWSRLLNAEKSFSMAIGFWMLEAIIEEYQKSMNDVSTRIAQGIARLLSQIREEEYQSRDF